MVEDLVKASYQKHFSLNHNYLMKITLLLLSSTLILGCSKPQTFVLNDTKENNYFVSELVNKAFEENQIDKSPLIVINGIPFQYNKKQDTIILPLKKSDIISLDFLNKNSSRIIYNEKENDGAIIITASIKNK
jgi:hypothetical protein